MSRTYSIITIHPQFIESYQNFGVFKAASRSQQAKIVTINLRDFAIDQRGTVDDRPYGGGEGMLLRADVLANAVRSTQAKRVVLLSPDGTHWNQERAEQYATSAVDTAFICGRFEGIDQRFIDNYVDESISVGDYILSGGETAALSVIDSILRLLPQVLGNEDSANLDSLSISQQRQLKHPQYTRPLTFEGKSVPAVLVSGHHENIAKWRQAAKVKRNPSQVKKKDIDI